MIEDQSAQQYILLAENSSGHSSHSAADVQPKDAINSYLSTVSDHRTLSFFHYKIADLPVIIYDKQAGLHVYSDINSMEQEGLFTEVGEQIVHKSNTAEAVSFDASITSLVCFEWIAMLLGIIFFAVAGHRAKKRPLTPPRGIQNMLEAVVGFIKNQVIAPNCPAKVTEKLQHYFYALFFFILICNLVGLVHGGHAATGSIATTLALAVIAFFVINITSMVEGGVGKWFKSLLGGAPWPLAFIMVPIEIISLFTKPFALTIRLFANMTAGHVVLLSLIGLTIVMQSYVMAGVSVAFSVFMLALELLVAFLQAYIFTILTAVFTGLAVGEH